jgi:hypothetical protein
VTRWAVSRVAGLFRREFNFGKGESEPNELNLQPVSLGLFLGLLLYLKNGSDMFIRDFRLV